MDIDTALAHVREHPNGTLATLLPDGRPHLSVVSAAVLEGQLWISTVQTLVKTANLRRDPRASFATGLGPWAAIEGDVTLDDGEGILDRLRLYYRTLRGEHPDWDDYDAAMVRDRRLLLRLTPVRAYGYGLA